jgi:hypothetical protein
VRTDRRAADDLIRYGDRSDDRDVIVATCGRLCLHRKRINISTVLAGRKLGIKEVDEGIWFVSFMHYDLGNFDMEQKTLQPLDNPFGTRLSPICHPCVRAYHSVGWRSRSPLNAIDFASQITDGRDVPLI